MHSRHVTLALSCITLITPMAARIHQKLLEHTRSAAAKSCQHLLVEYYIECFSWLQTFRSSVHTTGVQKVETQPGRRSKDNHRAAELLGLGLWCDVKNLFPTTLPFLPPCVLYAQPGSPITDCIQHLTVLTFHHSEIGLARIFSKGQLRLRVFGIGILALSNWIGNKFCKPHWTFKHTNDISHDVKDT